MKVILAYILDRFVFNRKLKYEKLGITMTSLADNNNQFCAKSKCVSLSASDCRSMLKQMVSNIYAQGAVFRMAEVPLGGRNQNLQLMDILTNRIQHEIQGSLIVKHTSL